MLTLHIIIALLSTGLFSVLLVKNKPAFKVASVISLIFTIFTGAMLIAAKPSSIGHACLSGIAYFAVVGALLVIRKTYLRSA